MPQDRADEVRALAARPFNWDELFLIAAENSIASLLEPQLHAIVPAALGPSRSERWKDERRANAAQCLRLTAGLIEALAEFRLRSIPAIPYKGPVLAAQAYGDVALREFDDLDIVVRQRDMENAHRAMRALGFRPKFASELSPGPAAPLIPGEYKYHDEARDVIVELHTELTMRHFPVVPGLDAFFERRTPVVLSGHEVRTFSPEDALLALSVHGAKDFWSRLSWIADISELIQSHALIDWDEVLRRAECLRAQRMVRLALWLAASLLDAPLPQEVVSLLRKDPIAKRVAMEIGRRLLTRRPCPAHASSRFCFRLRMLPGVVAPWRYAGRLAVAPAEDWLAVRLPKPLAPFHALLRPLRLTQKLRKVRRHEADSR